MLKTTGLPSSRAHMSLSARSISPPFVQRPKPRLHPPVCLQPRQERQTTRRRKRSRSHLQRGQQPSPPRPNLSPACQSPRLQTSLQVRAHSLALRPPRLEGSVQSPLLQHLSLALRARHSPTREERHRRRSGPRRRRPVARPLFLLPPMLQVAQLLFRANKVEEVAGKVVTPANHGLLYRPPEQGSLPATSVSNVRVTHLNRRNQLRLQLGV